MIDIHTHILFGVDDGAKSLDDSLALLKEAKKQGINTVYLTPHFYTFNTDIDSLKNKVEENFNVLLSTTNSEIYPEIRLGYEVHYFKGIYNSTEIKKFTLDKSNFLLLELDFNDITEDVINNIEEIRWQLGLIPIIAHIERYHKLKGFKKLLKLLDHENFLAQVTATSVAGLDKYKNITAKLIKKDYVDFIASDAHNLKSRSFNFKEAAASLKNMIGSIKAKTLISNSQQITNSRWLFEKRIFARYIQT